MMRYLKLYTCVDSDTSYKYGATPALWFDPKKSYQENLDESKIIYNKLKSIRSGQRILMIDGMTEPNQLESMARMMAQDDFYPNFIVLAKKNESLIDAIVNDDYFVNRNKELYTLIYPGLEDDKNRLAAPDATNIKTWADFVLVINQVRRAISKNYRVIPCVSSDADAWVNEQVIAHLVYNGVKEFFVYNGQDRETFLFDAFKKYDVSTYNLRLPEIKESEDRIFTKTFTTNKKDFPELVEMPASYELPTFYIETNWNTGPGSAPLYDNDLWKFPNVVISSTNHLAYFPASSDIEVVASSMAATAKSRLDNLAESGGVYTSRWAWRPMGIGAGQVDPITGSGQWRNNQFLFNHPFDMTHINSSNPSGGTDPYTWGGISSTSAVPWAASGVAWNRAWMQEFCPIFKSYLELFGVPDPEIWLETTEQGVGNLYNTTWRDLNYTQFTGWVDRALADPRATSTDPEYFVDGVQNMRDWWDSHTTYVSEAGTGLIPDPVSFSYSRASFADLHHPVNRPYYLKAVSLMHVGYAYAVNRAFKTPFKAVFPNTSMAHYEGSAITSNSMNGILSSPGPTGYQQTDHDNYYGFDFSSPGGGFYGDTLSNFPTQVTGWPIGDNLEWSTTGNWLRRYPKPQEGFEKYTSLQYATLQKSLRNIQDVANNIIPVCPWISRNDTSEDWMVDFIKGCYDRGVRNFVIWENSLFGIESEYEAWIPVITRVNEWVLSLSRASLKRTSTVSKLGGSIMRN